MRSALALVVAIASCKGDAKDRAAGGSASTARPLDAALPPIPGWPELADLGLASPVWVRELEPRIERPEYAAHAPLTVGERIIIAGSRLGYLGVDRASGEIDWRRPSGPRLAAPLALAADDVVLLHDCDEAVGAPSGRAVLACFDRIDPKDIAARASGRIHVAEDEVGDCVSTAGGAWSVSGADARALTVGRGACRFRADLDSSAAERLPDAAPAADPWRQEISGGTSHLVRDGAPALPGLLILAEAPNAAVVRLDSSLRRDYVAAFDGTGVRWVWPLPPPPDAEGRGGPVGISSTDRDVVVLFDGSRLARLSSTFSPPP